MHPLFRQFVYYASSWEGHLATAGSNEARRLGTTRLTAGSSVAMTMTQRQRAVRLTLSARAQASQFVGHGDLNPSNREGIGSQLERNLLGRYGYSQRWAIL